MFRTRLNLVMPQALFLVRAAFKLTLGLFFLSFLLPLNFPPTKPSTVYAQEATSSAQPAAQTQNVDASSLPIVFQLPFEGYLTTHFSAYHPGVDLATGFGMPIKPIAEGTVIDTEFNFFGYGMMVVIDNGHGYQSLYAHMNRIYVQKGQQVSKDTILGEVGLTGRTTGPHTHLEVSKDGVKIDPLTILPPVRQVPQPQDFVTYDKPSAESMQAIASASAQLATYQGGSTQTPTLGNTKIQPDSSPVPTPIPQTSANLSVVNQLDLSQILNTKPTAKPSFLSL